MDPIWMLYFDNEDPREGLPYRGRLQSFFPFACIGRFGTDSLPVLVRLFPDISQRSSGEPRETGNLSGVRRRAKEAV